MVVNGGVTPNAQTRSPGQPRITTTIPVGEGTNTNTDPGATVPHQPPHLKVSPAKKTSSPKGPGVNGEGKRATHEKNKSVTIVVNDQQVSVAPGRPHHPGHADSYSRAPWGRGGKGREIIICV